MLPYGSQYAPTRWLMKAVWEVAHGPKPPLAAVGGGLRSAGEKDATVLDLYRKLSGDFGSPREEVCGTGERAHLRCTRSYVLSSQHRRWLNQIPAFVPLPSGWQPPPLPALRLTPRRRPRLPAAAARGALRRARRRPWPRAAAPSTSTTSRSIQRRGGVRAARADQAPRRALIDEVTRRRAPPGPAP